MRHRIFAALPVPNDIGEPLMDLQKGLPGASWRPLENFHITLRFFGEVHTALAREIDEALGEISAPQMQLEIDGVGWFGRREPRSIHARIAPNDALKKLSGACERAARRLGLPAEKRGFRPHITLAYLHDIALSDTMAWADRHGAYRDGPFWVDRFHLYESHFGRGPSRYVAEADYPLG